MLQDLRLAVRRLARTPTFTLVSIATLAIGIGANAAVFSLVNAIRLRPLPFAEPSQLVDVYEHNPVEVCAGCGVGTSYANFLDWRTRARSFSAMAAYREDPVTIGFTGATEKRRAARVSANLFTVLGVSPLRGRTLAPNEDGPGSSRVALISEGMWRAQFHADSSVLGSTVRVDGAPYEIVGVMPGHFAFPAFAELWLPLGTDADPTARNQRDIGVVARLRNGVSMVAASAEMSAIARSMETEFPATQTGWSAHIESLHSDLAGDYVGGFLMMLAAVACVLLITCANLANLMLARAISRRGELAVRAALGASRGRLAGQFLIESTIVALAGGVLGLVLAQWGIELLPAIKDLAGEGFPRWIDYSLDIRVYGFILGVSLISGLAFGAFAARFAERADLNDVLKEGGRGSTGGRSRMRSALAVVQISAALILVTVGGLLTKAMLRGRNVDPGYETRGLVRADLGITGRRYENASVLREFAGRVEDELTHSPGVSSSALMGLYVVNWPGMPHEDIAAEGLTQPPQGVSHIQNVTPAYFRALGTKLVSGREFNDRDIPGATPVAIVNETMARSLWGASNAIGKTIRIGTTTWSVVGIARDLKSTFSTGVRPVIFMPFAQHPQLQPGGQPLSLYVRASAGAHDLPTTVQAAVQRVDRDVSTNNLMSEDAFIRRLRSPYEAMAMLALALGAFAWLLAALGIYGVIAHFVSQRTQEIGVRVALGASPLDIVRLVVRYGLRLSVIGVVTGAIGAALATRLLGYMLFGVSPTDPAVFAIVTLTFVGAALLAAYLPARKATKVDPMQTLRAE
ncbi:MAG TPA: ABC transporter permease [Gemmatimonadaceae bacterium]|nr:ABC transporter permease [Gemmatimonadaceae bacterium]